MPDKQKRKPKRARKPKSVTIRVSEATLKTLSQFRTAEGEKAFSGTLVNEWATRIQAEINENCRGATNIHAIIFRPKSKALVIVTCLIPEFFGRLSLTDLEPDPTDIKMAFESVKKKVKHK